MAASNVLREFLVKIGFRIDEQKFRNFQEAMRTTGKNAVEMGKLTLAASGVMGGSLKVIGQQLESLYFAAQRTGASASELKEFSFAAAQIGVNAEQAQAAIEGLAAARRTNPGLNGILSGLGIDPRQTDNAKVMVELLAKLQSMPHYQGAQIAALFGLDERTFNQMETNLPEMQKYLALREKMFRAAGIDPSAMTGRSHEFMGHLRILEASVTNLAEIIAYRLMPAGEKVIDWLESVVEWLTKADKATDGWSSKLLGVASALAGGSLLKGGLGLLGRLAGGGALAAGGEAAGGGLLATIGLPAIIIAAVGAALVWMAAHPDKVRSAAKSAWEWTKNEASALPAQVKGIAKSIGDFHKQVQQSGGYVQSLSSQPGVLGDLARGIARMEGFYTNGTLANRRNNPGNIEDGKWAQAHGALPSDGGRFARFKSSADGFAAITALLTQKYAGMTLAQIISKWAPANENNTAAYIANVSKWSGISSQSVLIGKLGQAYAAGGRPVSISQKTDIHVTGDGAHSTAREIANQQSRVNGDMVRNFAGAVQ